MHQTDELATRFEAHRTRLRAVAYRMLGSLAEADDAVQETWLRLSRTDADEIENLGGWLTTVVSRVCLNMLRARATATEESLDARMPEPVDRAADGGDPEQEALLGRPVGLALLVVLDALGPAERLAFVLHDLFAVPFDEIAPIVGRSPGRDAPAREPRAAPGAGRRDGARSRPRAPAPRRRRVPRRRPRRRLRRARGPARPRRRASAPTSAPPRRRGSCAARARWPARR